MAPAPEHGVIFVGSRDEDVFAVYDQNKDGVAERVQRILTDLNVPNGIAWRKGYLYIAEQHRLVRYKFGQWQNPEVLYSDFPDKDWHGWRYAAFGPHGGLYVSIGAPCNVCDLDGMEGTIIRFEPQTWVPVITAHGVRNSVGFDFDPINHDLLFTDNGADFMGDDLPPDELNRAQVGGLHFGYPYYGGGQARTSDFMDHKIPPNRPPIHEFQAHVAPLGVHFYTGNNFPERYKEGVFVAQHGSWNRSSRVGYQVVFLPFDQRQQVIREERFAHGWLRPNQAVTGRPVDIKTWNDSLLISDDGADAIYIVNYHE
jgi:glucose/arabinose dehydrogenase